MAMAVPATAMDPPIFALFSIPFHTLSHTSSRLACPNENAATKATTTGIMITPTSNSPPPAAVPPIINSPPPMRRYIPVSCRMVDFFQSGLKSMPLTFSRMAACSSLVSLTFFSTSLPFLFCTVRTWARRVPLRVSSPSDQSMTPASSRASTSACVRKTASLSPSGRYPAAGAYAYCARASKRTPQSIVKAIKKNFFIVIFFLVGI